MHEIFMSLPAFGGPIFDASPSYCPTIKSVYPTLGGYRLLQDQARPEYAVLMEKQQRAAIVEMGVSKQLPEVAYNQPFSEDGAIELLWTRNIKLPDYLLAHTSMTSSSNNTNTYMVKVTTDNLTLASAVFSERVAENVDVLLRLKTAVEKRHLENLPLEILDGALLELEEGVKQPEHYVVSTASDEIVGTLKQTNVRVDDVERYTLQIVTADRGLAASILEAAGRSD